MNSIKIRNRLIGHDQPCFIIAEAGINHNGDINMALKLVDSARDAGADAVKFQKRHLPSLYPKALLNDPNLAEWSFQYILPALKDSELTDTQFLQIKEYCDEKKIRFMCTPWDVTSLELIEKLQVELHKVSSADLINFPLLDTIAATGRPVILSTGMATLPEIERTVEFLKKQNVSFALLHCVSAYPAPFESLNLRFIEKLKQFNVPVGYSGHERGISIAVVAVTLGACIIEKHITLDRTLPGPDHAASLEPYGFKKMVRDIRIAEKAMGSEKKELCQIELLNRQVLRKSMVTAENLKRGTVVTNDMITVSGPGKGISPQRINDLLGVTLKRDITKGDYFCEGDLKSKMIEISDYASLRRPWGLKSRFHDLHEMLAFQSPIIELHFTESDIDFFFTPPPNPYPQRLFIHAPEFFDRKLLDLCSRNEDHREKSIQMLQKSIDKAMELAPFFTGPVGVVMHLGGMTMDENNRDFNELLDVAISAFHCLDPKDTLLLPENLPPRPWYLGGQWNQNIFSSWQDMVRLCTELNVQMTLDVSHAQLYCTLAGEKLKEYINNCLPYIHHMHIADASGIDGEGLQIGEGVIEWEGLLNQLSEIEFSWLPEVWSGHLNRSAGFVEAINRIIALGGL